MIKLINFLRSVLPFILDLLTLISNYLTKRKSNGRI